MIRTASESPQRQNSRPCRRCESRSRYRTAPQRTRTRSVTVRVPRRPTPMRSQSCHDPSSVPHQSQPGVSVLNQDQRDLRWSALAVPSLEKILRYHRRHRAAMSPSAADTRLRRVSGTRRRWSGLPYSGAVVQPLVGDCLFHLRPCSPRASDRRSPKTIVDRVVRFQRTSRRLARRLQNRLALAVWFVRSPARTEPRTRVPTANDISDSQYTILSQKKVVAATGNLNDDHRRLHDRVSERAGARGGSH